MLKAYRVLTIGLIFQLVGFVWDLLIHAQRGIAEGLDVFFKIPAHDLITIGFLLTIFSFYLFSKELWQRKQ